MSDDLVYNSIVVARNMGIGKKDRKACNIGIENFLISVLALHGLNPSDIINISLEKYLRENGYLNESVLDLVEKVSIVEKEIFKNNLL